jgi:hypothetical protein
LLGYDAFEFDFTSLEGTGFLVVELGSPSAVYGPEANRVAIDTAGVVTLPFSQLNFANNGTLGSFDVITFTFEAESQEFSMTVNEIRAVPEPSVLALATSFLVTILLRRRRN